MFEVIWSDGWEPEIRCFKTLEEAYSFYKEMLGDAKDSSDFDNHLGVYDLRLVVEVSDRYLKYMFEEHHSKEQNTIISES